MKNCYPALQNSGADFLAASDLQREAEGWLLCGEVARWSERTPSDRRWWIRRLVTFLSDKDLTFSVDGLRRFFLAVEKAQDAFARGPRSPASAKHGHSQLTALGNWLVEEGRLSVILLRRIPAPALRDPGIEPCTDEEINRMLEAARNSRNRDRDVALLYSLFASVRFVTVNILQ